MVLLHDTCDQQIQEYSEMNSIIKKFGLYVLNEDWESAFQFAERKTDYQQRMDLLLHIRTVLEQKYGKLIDIDATGTLPDPDFYAMTLMEYQLENGSASVLIVWQKTDEFLGFKPMIQQHAISTIAVISTSVILAYVPDLAMTFRFKLQNGEIVLI